MSNPFKMGFENGNNNKQDLFFAKQDDQKSQKLFEKIIDKDSETEQQ